MAGITSFDSENGRICTIWAEAGVQFRSNIVEAGGQIELHKHSYDHVALITQGWFAVKEIAPSGEEKNYQVAAKGHQPKKEGFAPVGYRVTIPAWHQHSFKLIEGPGEVLCLWPG